MKLSLGIFRFHFPMDEFLLYALGQHRQVGLFHAWHNLADLSELYSWEPVM